MVHGTGKCDASAVNHRATMEVRTSTTGHSNHGANGPWICCGNVKQRRQVRSAIDVETVPHTWFVPGSTATTSSGCWPSTAQVTRRPGGRGTSSRAIVESAPSRGRGGLPSDGLATAPHREHQPGRGGRCPFGHLSDGQQKGTLNRHDLHDLGNDVWPVLPDKRTRNRVMEGEMWRGL